MTTYNEYLYIDFENVHDIDTNFIKENTKIRIIAGQDQKSIPFELTAKIQKFGDSVDWIKVEGKGKNALDFFIVHYLTKDCENDHDKAFTIYSKDTGYDPLIKHLKSKKINAKRVETLHPQETKPKVVKPEIIKVDNPLPKETKPAVEKADPNLQKTIDFLNTFKPNSRPKKRKILTNSIASHMMNEKPEEINRIVQLLIKKKFILEEATNVKFNLPKTDKK